MFGISLAATIIAGIGAATGIGVAIDNSIKQDEALDTQQEMADAKMAQEADLAAQQRAAQKQAALATAGAGTLATAHEIAELKRSRIGSAGYARRNTPFTAANAGYAKATAPSQGPGLSARVRGLPQHGISTRPS